MNVTPFDLSAQLLVDLLDVVGLADNLRHAPNDGVGQVHVFNNVHRYVTPSAALIHLPDQVDPVGQTDVRMGHHRIGHVTKPLAAVTITVAIQVAALVSCQKQFLLSSKELSRRYRLP